MKLGRRPTNIPKEQVKAEELYLGGIKKKDISWQVGVSLMTIYRWAEQFGWEEKYKEKYEKELSEIPESGNIMYLATHRCPKLKKLLKSGKFKKTYKMIQNL